MFPNILFWSVVNISNTFINSLQVALNLGGDTAPFTFSYFNTICVIYDITEFKQTTAA